MSRILIEYLPPISEKGMEIIQENISPSMTSSDGESNQYDLDIVLKDIGHELPHNDQEYLGGIHNEDVPVEYIEM